MKHAIIPKRGHKDSKKNRAKGERAKRPKRLNMNNHKTDTGQKYEF